MKSDADVVREFGRSLSNWGRWGADDQLGTLNLIGPEQVAGAAGCIRSGITFPLCLPLSSSGPQTGKGRRNNAIHVMTYTGVEEVPFDLGANAHYADDMVVLSCQGSTQWDALSHFFYDGSLYNGVPSASIDGSGAARNSIFPVFSKFLGRGILLDIPRYLQVPRCLPDEPITTEVLIGCARSQETEVRVGDILLVRTGAMTLVNGDDWSAFIGGPLPGVHYTVAAWLRERGVAAIASDNIKVESLSPLPSVLSPLHMVALRDMGLHLGELWYLEELAEDCARDGRYDFFLAAQAMPIVGAVGSPVTPVAVK